MHMQINQHGILLDHTTIYGMALLLRVSSLCCMCLTRIVAAKSLTERVCLSTPCEYVFVFLPFIRRMQPNFVHLCVPVCFILPMRRIAEYARKKRRRTRTCF